MAKVTPDRSKPRLRKADSSATEKKAPRIDKDYSDSHRFRDKAASAIKPAQPALSGLGRILSLITPRYFVNSWREVRQVTWPGRGETWRLTLAVFIFASIFGALVAGVDKGLDEIFKKLVLKN